MQRRFLDVWRRPLWAASFCLSAVIVFLRNIADMPVCDDHFLLENAKQCVEFGQCAVFSGSFFRPFGSWVWWGTFAIGGENPIFHHIIGFLIHGLCSWMVAELVFRWTSSKKWALAVGLLFLIHPIHAEAVIWLAGRFDLLATAALLAIILIWVDASKRLGVGRILAVILLTAIAILSKETGYLAVPLVVIMAVTAKKEHGIFASFSVIITACLLLLVRRLIIGTFAGGYEGEFDFMAWFAQAYGVSSFEWLMAPTNETANMPDSLVWILRACMLAPLPFSLWGLLHQNKKLDLLILPLALVLIPPMLSGIGYASGVGLQHGRYHYLPTAGYLLILGVGLAANDKHLRGQSRYTLLPNVAIILAILAYAVVHDNQSFIWSNAASYHETLIAQVTKDLSTRLPAVDEREADLVLIGGPQNFRGAYVFRIAEAVARRYPEKRFIGYEVRSLTSLSDIPHPTKPTYLYAFDWADQTFRFVKRVQE